MAGSLIISIFSVTVSFLVIINLLNHTNAGRYKFSCERCEKVCVAGREKWDFCLQCGVICDSKNSVKDPWISLKKDIKRKNKDAGTLKKSKPSEKIPAKLGERSLGGGGTERKGSAKNWWGRR